MATTSGYDGRIGGKFRREHPRRTAATPYDRPASAARGILPRGLVATAGGGNGWLSKLVDPASRFIAGSASRFFSSVFRKRLTAPPAELETQGANDPIRNKYTEAVSTETLHELGEGRATDLTNLPNRSDTTSISEFEQILQQKTLTSDEFERLADILRSRIINSDNSDPVTSNKNIDNDNSDPVTSNKNIDNALEKNMDEPHAGKLTHGVMPANVLEDSRSHGDPSKPLVKSSVPASALERTRSQGDPLKPLMKLAIPEDEAASPTELAKAYMGSRTSQLPSSALRLRNHVCPEENRMPSMLGAKPSFSVGQRSILRASSAAAECAQDGYMTPRPLGRSAIFKMSRSPYFRSNATSSVKGRRHSRDDPSSSFQTPKAIMYSGGKEQLLKRGSSVLDGDLGSFGPIRRTRQKFSQTPLSKHMPLVPDGKLPLKYNNDMNGDSTSIQKSLHIDELNYDATDVQNSEREVSRDDLVQSNKIAMKISQELNKFVPSPKEKSPKVLSLDASNINKSHLIVESQTLRKFKDLDTSEFRTFGSLGNSTTPGIKNPLIQRQEEATYNGSSTSDGSGVKLLHEDFKHNGIVSPIDCVTSKGTLKGSLDANNHAPILRETSTAPLTLKERVEVKISLDKCVGPETDTQKHCHVQSSTSALSPDLKVTKMEEERDFTGTISENVTDFCFPSTYVSNSYSLPPTPTMPGPLVQETVAQNDQHAAPLHTFGSKNVNEIAISSRKATDISTDPSQGSTRSFAISSTAQLPMLNKVEQSQKSRVVFKSFGDVDSTEKTASPTPVFAFGVKAGESLNNGSLYSSSLSFSAAGAAEISANGANLSSNNSDPSLTSGSFISPASESVDVPFFKFGSDTVPQLLVKSNVSQLETAKASLFTTNDSNAGNNAMSTPVAAQLSGSSSWSTLVTSMTIPSTESSSFAQVESAVSPSNQSAKVPELPPSIVSKSNTLFGSTQYSSLITSTADHSTKTSSVAFAAGTGSVCGTQNQSGSEVSHFSKNSTNRFGSLSSSPSFGLDSSSSEFGSIQFGAASTDSKPFSSTFSSSLGAGSSNSATTSSFVPQNSSSSTGFSFMSPGTNSGNASSFQTSTSSFSSAFSPSAPISTAFSFPSSTSVSSSSPLVSFPGSLFSFTSSSTTAGQSVFGRPSSVGFNSASPGNDQMNVEDSVAVTNAPLSATSASGIPGNLHMPVFGTPEVQPAAPVFQFGGNQNHLTPNPSPFQAASSGEFSAGGKFSLGSGGGDKSGRRIIKVRRDKLRKK